MASNPRASPSQPVVQAPSVSQPTLIGVLWSGTAFSIIVVSARLVIRLKLFGRLKIDDYLVLWALAFNLTSTLIWTVLSRDLYITLVTEEADWASLLNVIAEALHGNLASYICSWSCLWSIKLSFMAFFHGLGRQIRSQQILWWCVLVFIVATYAVCVGMFDYTCLTSAGQDVLANCNTQRNLDYEYANTRVSTTFDIVTDALIVAVSANIVWRVHLPWRKKLLLAFICSLTIFMMIVAIVRITVGAPGKAPDLSWLLLWNSVEMTLAIFVACIASFRSLFCYTKSTRPVERAPSGQQERPSRRQPFTSTLAMDTLLDAENSHWVRQPSQDSREGLWLSDQAIYRQTAVSPGVTQ
ncbi:hypothetical protein F5X96DRAFT_620776 [Biscogniauxia mediterranea]|nr:hypothetical protein F5X96DRAFT_620776 [Biscogniauxia mediterranea]